MLMTDGFIRAFQGPGNDETVVQQALAFGEQLQSEHETSVNYNSYFSVIFGSKSEQPSQGIWFVKSN